MSQNKTRKRAIAKAKKRLDRHRLKKGQKAFNDFTKGIRRVVEGWGVLMNGIKNY